ncbi:flagellar brake domain-containing protein [Pullulanibacillus sp. KACC 23026]|uniref:flagellar brake protein n=1 Tax=Pullulanibacillus sp. KACC 23026 TaxID=3028315 RepID=UPI0023AF2CDF|nr:flagellar brake domain-containing protein [Pullulanibacillus sp. KACC 23026]WEG11245.1 flagellar brake domain-containing protein [Pullulanibacillus sp. KACC 23026]
MYPKVNQNVLIETDSDHSCRSVISGIEDNELSIMLLDRDMIGLLTEGEKLAITYILETNKYQFKSTILGRKLGPIPLIRLTRPHEKDIIKIQQRENFRVSAALTIDLKDQEVAITNISAGGLLVTAPIDFPIETDEMVTGSFLLPLPNKNQAEQISFDGQVKRIAVQEKLEDKKQAGIEFIKISQRDQTKIMQYCFEKQRQNRLKEKQIR